MRPVTDEIPTELFEFTARDNSSTGYMRQQIKQNHRKQPTQKELNEMLIFASRFHKI